ncbi:MAG: hypothetical protein C0498_01500 [Anaerolinea sp.]|nr:hypothetical protein [Anaerolinea sp.]
MSAATDCAYLAGLIDGEGSIMANQKHERRPGHSPATWSELRVDISNTDRGLIDWVNERWPGKVRVQVRPGVKDTWHYYLNTQQVVPLLEAALPYLVSKRERAELALELARGTRNPGRAGYPPEVRERRRWIGERIRELNRKGRAA